MGNAVRRLYTEFWGKIPLISGYLLLVEPSSNGFLGHIQKHHFYTPTPARAATGKVKLPPPLSVSHIPGEKMSPGAIGGIIPP